MQLTLYVWFGLGPIIIGCKFIYDSQFKTFDKSYQQEMSLGVGIVILLVGFFVGWACLVKFVELYKYYKNDQFNT